MSEAPGVVRTTISVPRELKARMDAAAESTNWSAIACEAFRTRLLQLESERKGTTMDELIARMRAADELEANEDYAVGREAGEAWVRGDATPKELRRLARFDFSQFDWEASDHDAYGPAHHLFEAIRLGPDGDRAAAEEFWEDRLGEKYPEGRLLKGFVDGALELWKAVEQRL